MADTPRTVGYLLGTSFVDGQAPGAIRPQQVRDFVVSSMVLNGGLQTANYVAALTDGGAAILMNAAGAVSVTIPANATVAFYGGTILQIVQYGAGQVTISAAVGVTLRTSSSLTTRAQYSVASVWKVGTDEWIVSGDLT